MTRYLFIEIGIDLAAFSAVGIPVLLILMLPTLRVQTVGKRMALLAFSLYLAAVASVVGLPNIGHLV